jgi:hypothetical protein
MEWEDLLQYRFMRHANAYANGDSNGYAYTDSYANCNGNGYAHTDSYANGDSNGYAHTDSYGNCYSNGDCDRTAAAFTDGAASTDTAAAPVGSGTSYPLTRELANDPASSPSDPRAVRCRDAIYPLAQYSAGTSA